MGHYQRIIVARRAFSVFLYDGNNTLADCKLANCFKVHSERLANSSDSHPRMDCLA